MEKSNHAHSSTSLGLGLDESGSVMAEMMALFTPPGRDAKKNNNPLLNPRPVELHPYFKRPGKGHNHDCCDACGEGGDLICCDNCPASFHFSCHSPPLEEEDIPMGDWICLRCYVREKSRHNAIKAASRAAACLNTSEGIELSSDATNGVEDQTASHTAKPLRSGRASGRSTSHKKQLEQALKQEKENKTKIYKIKYDKYLEAKPVTNSPLDALISAAQVANAEQFLLPKELESRELLPFSWKWSDERQDDIDNQPKYCTSCRKSNRKIPSIACDFCPNVYHLDCLDPPLCEVPKERWMCPNHVEHFLDSNLVTSTSLTERLNIWGKYAKAPIDPETVKLDFLRKARSGKLFRKRKQKTPLEHRVKVPQFIKDQYKQRLPGYSIESSFVPTPSLEIPPQNKNSNNEPAGLNDPDIEDEFLSHLITFQTSFLERKLAKNSKNDNLIKDQGKDSEKAETRNEEPSLMEIESDLESQTKGNTEHVKNKEIQSKEDDDTERPKSPAASSDAETLSNFSYDMDQDDEGDDNTASISSELFQELKELLVKSRKKGDGFINLKTLPKVVKNFLALKKLKELFPEIKEQLKVENEVQARACLVPLSYSRKLPALMKMRCLTMGLGSQNAIDFNNYGFCNYVSSRHACIYFDQYSQLYEMINYSEHGTIVDNVVYALHCKTPTKKVDKIAVENKMSYREEEKKCFCETSVAKMMSNNQGCENSAILHHGSYMRFGCLQFVFSILDYYENNDKADIQCKKSLAETKTMS